MTAHSLAAFDDTAYSGADAGRAANRVLDPNAVSAHQLLAVPAPMRDSAHSKQLDVNDDARRALDAMLTTMVRSGGSDLHVTVGRPPMVRVHGDVIPLPGWDTLTPADTAALVRCVVTDEQWATFQRDLEFDLAYSLAEVSRFRINLFQQRNSYGAVMRAIPYEIKELHELGMPEQIAQFAGLPRGLVLVTGPTGSGKTTTLAALLDLANRNRKDHIVTIEDPIEFVHQHNKCVVNQRELGVDTHSFAEALKHVLRQDPDIILVGEMRDLATIQAAVTAAETGHIVFGTLHTNSAEGTVNRIIDVFPKEQQDQIRTQLSVAILGVLAQALVPRIPKGLVAAYEMLVVTPAISNLIRENKTYRIDSSIQTGRKHGMILLDDSLYNLWKQGLILEEEAMYKSRKPEELRMRIDNAKKGIMDEEEGGEEDDD